MFVDKQIAVEFPIEFGGGGGKQMFNVFNEIKNWTFEHICIQFSIRIQLLKL